MPTPEGEAPVETPEKKRLPEANRMANMGTSIFLKKLGREVTVRELSMESVIRCAGELSQLLAVIDFDRANQAAVILQMILQSEPTARAARLFAAECTGTKPKDWDEAPVSDWIKFIRAARVVIDWDDMRELFTELGLMNLVRQFRVQATEDQTVPDESETPQPS